MPTAAKKKAVAKKAAPKKVTAAKTKPAGPLFDEVILKVWNFKNIPIGSIVKGTIGKRSFTGRLQHENNKFYLCQDAINGQSCENKLGYGSSYSIGSGSPEDLKNNSVIITDVTLDPTFVIPPPPKKFNIRGHRVEFKKGYIQIGCTTVRNTVFREMSKELID